LIPSHHRGQSGRYIRHVLGSILRAGDLQTLLVAVTIPVAGTNEQVNLRRIRKPYLALLSARIPHLQTQLFAMSGRGVGIERVMAHAEVEGVTSHQGLNTRRDVGKAVPCAIFGANNLHAVLRYSGSCQQEQHRRYKSGRTQ